MRVYTHSKVLLESLGEAFMQMGRYVGKAQGVGGGKGVLLEPDPRKIEKEGLAHRPGWKCTLRLV